MPSTRTKAKAPETTRTWKGIAAVLGVHVTTAHSWAKTHEEFAALLSYGPRGVVQAKTADLEAYRADWCKPRPYAGRGR